MTTSADREVPPPSMRDLLSACAAATAVSTPPAPSADQDTARPADDAETETDAETDPDAQPVESAQGRRAG
ncbi:hypothetical protein ACFCZT_29155 [Streptomyces sp. NPDC056230]|uniref:hypothetical protein n=1 Tax=Streptomyces sp. NPDC056230 TaxID=3345754 RepID=UPI0035D9D8E2